MDIASYIENIGQRARQVSRLIARADTQTKNQALLNIAGLIRENAAVILAANRQDLDRASGLDSAMIDRLTLTEKSVRQMADGVEQIASLPDPVGEIDNLKYRPSGIQVGQMRVPLGVIGIIYESRPNVTVDAAALCVKSGNACILRGGSEAIESNRAIASLLYRGLADADLPSHIVQVIDTTDRDAVGHLITLRGCVDVIVPRGGKALIARLLAESRIPLIQHLDGNCHVYLDDSADAKKALPIVENAKTQRYGTCNTAESLLVAQSAAARLLPDIAARLIGKGVEIRACDKARALIDGAKPATEADYAAEFLAPIISIKIVENIDEAIAHINAYGSHHTDAIVTENHFNAMKFLREVDSASVMLNASTRFADGFEYGLGAEIGVSTDKLHARGPVGLLGLTSQKWIVLGDGHVRA